MFGGTNLIKKKELRKRYCQIIFVTKVVLLIKLECEILTDYPFLTEGKKDMKFEIVIQMRNQKCQS